MAKKPYTVDYHMICVVYFSDDVPTGSELAKLWTGLAVLGDHRAEIHLSGRGAPAASSLKKCKLGADNVADALIAADQIDLLSISAVRSGAQNAVLDSDVNFGFKRDGVWG